MTITLAVFTDGRRECIEPTLESARENLRGPIDNCWLFDDSGDADYHDWLLGRFPNFHVFGHERLGFAGTYNRAWQILANGSNDWVFGLEDDFTFNRPVDLTPVLEVLELHPDLAQLALRRQAWNDEERTAGGVVEMAPDAYTEVSDLGETWLEHRLFFTTNPSLYRRSLCQRGWPLAEHSEGIFTAQLFEDPDVRCGYWGARDSGEWVTHIGRERVGHGY